MRIELRMVPRLSDGGLGRTKVFSKNRAVIEIAEDCNQDLVTFGITLFHELLHVWTNIMKTNGAAIDMRKEHRFIFAMHKPLAQKIYLMRRKQS